MIASEAARSSGLQPEGGPRQQQSDAVLLERSLQHLQAHSFIEYSGEYGPEITTFIPYVHWLHQSGHLKGRKVITYSGMRPYYYFLDDSQFEAKQERRSWVPEERRNWPNNSTYTAKPRPFLLPPDYRTHFRRHGPNFDLPILFIQNKFAVEWRAGPVNFLPLSTLDRLIKSCIGRFQIVYSRPGSTIPASQYSADKNSFCSYPDMDIVGRYPEVVVLEGMQFEGMEYNALKLCILAKSHLFVSVQGGGAHLLAYFGNSLMLLLHRRGGEFPHAYRHGPYKYLSHPPPVLLVAQSWPELHSYLPVIASAQISEGRITLPAALKERVEASRV